MSAICVENYGGPEVMQLRDLPLPVPGAGEALVRIHAASVNFLDVQQRRGDLVGQAFYKHVGAIGSAFPTFIGTQGVGVVEEMGSGDSRIQAGDRVAFYGPSYATHAIVSAAHLIPIPDEIDFELAAAGLNQGFVAYIPTHLSYPVKAGDWCLVQAAAGGIGLLICQMAKLRGGRVIGVTSSEEKSQYVKEAGAEEVIISTQVDVVKEVKRITQGRGVNVVYDGVGKDMFETNLDSLAPRGYLVIYGQSSGFIPPFDLMTLQEKGSLFITRNSAAFHIDEYPNYLKQFVSWIRQGQLSVRIDRTFPLAEAAQAHAAFEQRRISGRVLLLP